MAPIEMSRSPEAVRARVMELLSSATDECEAPTYWEIVDQIRTEFGVGYIDFVQLMQGHVNLAAIPRVRSIHCSPDTVAPDLHSDEGAPDAGDPVAQGGLSCVDSYVIDFVDFFPFNVVIFLLNTPGYLIKSVVCDCEK